MKRRRVGRAASIAALGTLALLGACERTAHAPGMHENGEGSGRDARIHVEARRVLPAVQQVCRAEAPVCWADVRNC